MDSQKNCWIYFNYILFNFQTPYFVIASSDFLILSLTETTVKHFSILCFYCFASATRFILTLYRLICQQFFQKKLQIKKQYLYYRIILLNILSTIVLLPFSIISTGLPFNKNTLSVNDFISSLS